MPFDNPYQIPVGDFAILVEARSRISDHKLWMKGTFADGERHCLLGALSLACASRSFSFPNRDERRLARMLALQLPLKAPLLSKLWLLPARRRLMLYNDDPRTRHDDVLSLFERAIHHLMSRASVHA